MKILDENGSKRAMLNRSLKIFVVLMVLFLAALALTGFTHAAKDQQAQLPRNQNAPDDGRAASPEGEKILVVSGRKLVLIDRASKAILWESNGLQGALCVSALPNGGFLVGEGKSIARVDGDGKTVSRASASFKMTTDVKPLEDGRMLVSDGPAGTVAEMDWSGNVTWQVRGLHHPSEAVRLNNGNTLVADGTAALKEFDSSGNLLRTTWLKQWAGSVQRLSDGNTLVGESKSFELLDINGHPMWSLQVPSRVTGVQRLSDGEYLISEPDVGSVAILDVGGRIIWEVTGLSHPWRAIYLR